MNNREILELCIEQAKSSTCGRSKCGAIIIDDRGNVIGRGYNSPANSESPRCHVKKSCYDSKVTDKTCCMHAEQRAIMDTLQNNSEKITGATLYFVRLDENDTAVQSSKPYCTICSKMALDSGIKYFALFHDLLNPTLYETQNYNNLSYAYTQE